MPINDFIKRVGLDKKWEQETPNSKPTNIPDVSTDNKDVDIDIENNYSRSYNRKRSDN